MASVTSRADRSSRRGRARTLAQWFCLVAGAALTAVGVLGFIADASFDTGNGVQGDSFLGFEVNGWHNAVHLLSGLTLLAAANTAPTARLVAIVFGLTYAVVTLVGVADGEDVFALLPVNGPDNILHLLLTAAALIAGFRSPTTRRAGRGARRHPAGGVEASDGRNGERAPAGRDDPLRSPR